MHDPPTTDVDVTELNSAIARAAASVRSADEAVELAKRLHRIAADLQRQAAVLRSFHDQISAALRDRDK